MVWVDVWRGDRVRSRLCVRQFNAQGLRDDLFAGTPDTLFIKYLWATAASCKDFGVLVVDISVAFIHARTDEEIYVKVPLGIKSARYWRLNAAVMERGKHQSTGKSSHATSLWQICFSNGTTSNRVVTSGFATVWTWNSTVTIFWCVG